MEGLRRKANHLGLALLPSGGKGELGKGAAVEAGDNLDVGGGLKGLAPDGPGLTVADAVLLAKRLVVEGRPGAFDVIAAVFVAGAAPPPFLCLGLSFLDGLVWRRQRVLNNKKEAAGFVSETFKRVQQ